MNDIKNILKAYNLSEIQISKFFEYYEYANEHDIRYPLYYALTKLMI